MIIEIEKQISRSINSLTSFNLVSEVERNEIKIFLSLLRYFMKKHNTFPIPLFE